MQRIRLICVGKVKEPYLREGIAEFSKRIAPYARLEILEIKDSSMEEEGEKIIAHLRPDEYTIALCVDGTPYSSMELSKLILEQGRDIRNLAFIIGGADGLSSRVVGKAHLKLSLSRMTFTHEMCRLFLIEQIYRAFTIIKGRPYHR